MKPLPRTHQKRIKATLFAEQQDDSHRGEDEWHWERREDINHAFLKCVYAKNAYVYAEMRLKARQMPRKAGKLSTRES